MPRLLVIGVIACICDVGSAILAYGAERGDCQAGLNRR